MEPWAASAFPAFAPSLATSSTPAAAACGDPPAFAAKTLPCAATPAALATAAASAAAAATSAATAASAAAAATSAAASAAATLALRACVGPMARFPARVASASEPLAAAAFAAGRRAKRLGAQLAPSPRREPRHHACFRVWPALPRPEAPHRVCVVQHGAPLRVALQKLAVAHHKQAVLRAR